MDFGIGLKEMPTASLVVDTSGAILASNEAAATLLRLSPSSPAGNLSEVFGSKWASDLVVGADRALSARAADGSHVEVLAFAKRSEGGNLLVSLVDVTDRVEHERELGELSQFPLLNPSPVLRFDRSGSVVFANPAALHLFRAVTLTGWNWTSICPGVTPELWKTIAESSGIVMHSATVGAEEVNWAHVRSASGDLVSAFGNVVTDLRRAQGDLERKALELAEVARFPDMNPGPVIRTDSEGSIVLANRAARTVFGDDLAGASWLKICPALSASIWNSVRTAPDTLSVEARINNRDWMFTHRRDHQSGMVFVYGADVTQQKRTETALRQSEKMATLGTLAAGVAHELNNPAAATRRAADQLLQKLTMHGETTPRDTFQNTAVGEAVANLVDRMRGSIGQIDTTDAIARSDRETELENWLADHDVPDPWDLAGSLSTAGVEPATLEPLAEVLEGPALAAAITWATETYEIMSLAYIVGLGASRISEIVGALKGYAYLGQAPIQEIDVRDGIENTLVIMRNKLKYGIVVTKQYADDLPPIPAYGSELNQVWTNLIDNAADAMGEKGELTIRTRSDGDYAVVEIEDSGPGIPPEAKALVFDPFFTTKPPGKGMGLGLSTTYSIIVDKHGGQITVDSRPGATTFSVRLPLRQQQVGEPR